MITLLNLDELFGDQAPAQSVITPVVKSSIDPIGTKLAEGQAEPERRICPVGGWLTDCNRRTGLIGRPYPSRSPGVVPPEILDTRQRCPVCHTRFILPELRHITCERCWTCAHS